MGGDGETRKGTRCWESQSFAAEGRNGPKFGSLGHGWVWLVKTMVCGLRRWVKCCCLQGKGTRVEVGCAGDEAELSLGAGDGADSWQGVVVGCRRVSLGWTSHTLGNRHCRTVIHPVAACPGGPLSSSVTVSHEGSAQLPSAGLGMLAIPSCYNHPGHSLGPPRQACVPTQQFCLVFGLCHCPVCKAMPAVPGGCLPSLVHRVRMHLCSPLSQPHRRGAGW